jgi:hypothetical protein
MKRNQKGDKKTTKVSGIRQYLPETNKQQCMQTRMVEIQTKRENGENRREMLGSQKMRGLEQQ